MCTQGKGAVMCISEEGVCCRSLSHPTSSGNFNYWAVALLKEEMQSQKQNSGQDSRLLKFLVLEARLEETLR